MDEVDDDDDDDDEDSFVPCFPARGSVKDVQAIYSSTFTYLDRYVSVQL